MHVQAQADHEGRQEARTRGREGKDSQEQAQV